MKQFIVPSIVFAGLILTGCNRSSDQPAAAGPNGGDLVPIKGGTAYAEVVANSDTGEVMVHTWDKDLKASRPIENEPVVVGSGENSVRLLPHPTGHDSAGHSSRFYGQADWVRGGGIHHGWLQGHDSAKHEFTWDRCWGAGREHHAMWSDMGEHRRMGPGHHGGHGDR